MPKKTKTPALATIDLGSLATVTGGIGGAGPGPAHRHKHHHQQQPQPWAPTPSPWAGAIPSPQPASTNGQAGLAGTPGAWVHNGRFRPL